MSYEDRGTSCCPHCGGRLIIAADIPSIEVTITRHQEEAQGELRPEGLPKGTDAKAAGQGEGARLKRGPKLKRKRKVVLDELARIRVLLALVDAQAIDNPDAKMWLQEAQRRVDIAMEIVEEWP